MIEVVSVNTSKEKGEIKLPVNKVLFTEEGLEGDCHAGAWHRQVSLLGMESIEPFQRTLGRAIQPGEFAENITTRGLALHQLPLFTRLLNDSVELEITQIGKKCHGTTCSIFQQTGDCIMPKVGVFARVIKGGNLVAGDTLQVKKRSIRALIITLSDRASKGIYEDKSGSLLKTRLQSHLKTEGWELESNQEIIPDEIELLQEMIRKKGSRYDLIFTTGSTGIGPRDIAPEAVRPLLDKEIPGIMEHIRLKYGAQKPNALLSRSLAGVVGTTLVYLLPGSPRAIEEYTSEIFKTMKHSLLMLHGIDSH